MKTLIEKGLEESPDWKDRKEANDKSSQEYLQELFSEYPELSVYYHYFNAYKHRNDYYIIMKQAIIHHLYTIKRYEKRMTLRVMGLILNLTHSTVKVHRSVGITQRHQDYNEVVLIMDKMIKEGKYPKAYINKKTRLTNYVWEKIIWKILNPF
jgi:hypothetical protein